MNWESLVCMGDSITRGSRTYLGYPELAADLLGRITGTAWTTWNFAWNGYRAIDLLRAVDERGADLARFNPSLCTIMIGTNDAKEGTSVDGYTVALRQLILKARLVAQNRHVIVLGAPTLAAGMSLPYNAGMNERIVAYNRVAQELTQRAGCGFLTMEAGPGDLVDGIHLSDAGVDSFSRQLRDRILLDRGIHG